MTNLRITLLPPIAIGRFGSADDPVDNFTLTDNPDDPLGYRSITPEPSFRINEEGEISALETPEKITFRDGRKIRPVAPFLELFCRDGDALKPFGQGDLPPGAHLEWSVEVANHKVFRRTNDPKDKVGASIRVTGHDPVPLSGNCEHFTKEGRINFGHVLFIRPTEEFPQFRLRFTPAPGHIYGPVARPGVRRADENVVPDERCIYQGGDWVGLDPDDDDTRIFPDLGYYNQTLPPSLYAISSPAPSWLNNNIAVSRGYLDDSCDGYVTARVLDTEGQCLGQASARICAGPPDIAPDAMFLRSMSDDLEQVINGPDPDNDEPGEMTRARALDIVRRAFETVRFMNLTVMNGNDFKGRSALTLDSMPQEESADTERALRPVMPPQTVDTTIIAQLHAQVYAALQGGSEAWFSDLLRRPEEVSDFTDYGRRKMPAMMCGADNGYLALTRRQIASIEKAAALIGYGGITPDALPAHDPQPELKARNRTALLNYKPQGNPLSATLSSSVANCCPGLEMDFRAVWRRLFTGITLREYDNLVVEGDGVDGRDLTGHHLMAVRLDDQVVEFTAPITGPAPSDPVNQILQTTNMNPNGRAPLEWSNALAPVIAAYQGQDVECIFTANPERYHQAYTPEEPDSFITVTLKVRHFFSDSPDGETPEDPDSLMISRALAEAGELTQGLCSPWQNDYRECSCYYWASARPDFVNPEVATDGLSSGDNWLQKQRTGNYVPDDYQDSRLMDYDDLFLNWERLLRFQIGGRDAPGEEAKV